LRGDPNRPLPNWATKRRYSSHNWEKRSLPQALRSVLPAIPTSPARSANSPARIPWQSTPPPAVSSPVSLPFARPFSFFHRAPRLLLVPSRSEGPRGYCSLLATRHSRSFGTTSHSLFPRLHPSPSAQSGTSRSPTPPGRAVCTARCKTGNPHSVRNPSAPCRWDIGVSCCLDSIARGSCRSGPACPPYGVRRLDAALPFPPRSVGAAHYARRSPCGSRRNLSRAKPREPRH
jgi:hypothetical protein